MKHYPYRREQGSYEWSDAIVLPDDHDWTDEQIEAEKDRRFANWYALITTPQVEGDIPQAEE